MLEREACTRGAGRLSVHSSCPRRSGHTTEAATEALTPHRPPRRDHVPVHRNLPRRQSVFSCPSIRLTRRALMHTGPAAWTLVLLGAQRHPRGAPPRGRAAPARRRGHLLPSHHRRPFRSAASSFTKGGVPSLPGFQLCDLRQVPYPLCASVSTSTSDGDSPCPTGLWGGECQAPAPAGSHACACCCWALPLRASPERRPQLHPCPHRAQHTVGALQVTAEPRAPPLPPGHTGPCRWPGPRSPAPQGPRQELRKGTQKDAGTSGRPLGCPCANSLTA